MMDRYIIEERLASLNDKQLKGVIECLTRLCNSQEKIDFNSLPREYSGLVRHFSKLSNKDKGIFLDCVKEFVKENLKGNSLAISDEISKSKVAIENKELANAPKKFQEEDIAKRIEKLNTDEKISLSYYLSLITNGEKIESIPARINGLVEFTRKVNTKDRMNVLEIIRNRLAVDSLNDEKLVDSVSIVNACIITEKKKGIFERIEKASAFSQTSQLEFLDDVSNYVASAYGKFARENRINNCNHDFGDWKDYSYTKAEDTVIDLQHVKVPIKHPYFERKCKKCNYVESVNYVPDEVIEMRKKKEKENKIKKLRRELKKLENGE